MNTRAVQSEPLRCNLTGMKGCAYPANAAPEQSERGIQTSPSQEGCAVGIDPVAAPNCWSEGQSHDFIGGVCIKCRAPKAPSTPGTLPLSAEQIDVFNRDGCTDEEFHSVCRQALHAKELERDYEDSRRHANEEMDRLERQVAEKDKEIKRLRLLCDDQHSSIRMFRAELAELRKLFTDTIAANPRYNADEELNMRIKAERRRAK